MTREVHQIPPAPRRGARWSAALWHRWPLALGGFVLAVYGGLWTLMLFFASSGKPIDDTILDQASERASGIVTLIEPTRTSFAQSPYERVRYHFRVGDSTLHGASFVPEGFAVVGDPVQIEYLQRRSNVNRVVGGRLSLLDDFVQPAFWLTVVPGFVLIAAWLIGAARTRRLLIHGDVAVATVLAMRRLRWIVPSMLSVRFQFRDRNAIERSGEHWVRERSRAGQRLVCQPHHTTIIHDRDHPNRQRLVSVDEFS